MTCWFIDVINVRRSTLIQASKARKQFVRLTGFKSGVLSKEISIHVILGLDLYQ